jgi:anti-sigma factor RsiW
MRHPPDDHVDPRLLVAYKARLLDEARTAAIDRHLAGCDACRERLEAARAQAPDDEHIPPSILARWDRVRLKGLQRELVRRHLESCATCRDALVMLGHEPKLDRIPELEATRKVIEALDEAEAFDPELVPVGPFVQPRKTREFLWKLREFWQGAGFGAALATAAALAIVLAVPLRQAPPEGEPPQDGRQPPLITGSPKPAPSNLRLGFVQGMAAGTAGLVTRSGEEAMITTAPGQRVLRVNFQPLEDVSPGQRIEVELLDPTGQVVDSLTTTFDLLVASESGLALISDTPLEPDTVRLRLAWMGPDGRRREAPHPLVLARE